MSVKLRLKKEGMTSMNIGNERVPVTLLSFEKHVVTQVKNVEKDGYQSVQIATGKLVKKPSKPAKGHFAASNSDPLKQIFEYKCDDIADISVGGEIGLDQMDSWKYVDAQAVSTGKGFTGVMKAWNFGGQRASHGNSLSHRAPGSIGQCQDPGRVFKGKKMARRHGGINCTIQALEVVEINHDNMTVAVRGSVPGPKGSYVFIKKSIKKSSGDKS
mgnify:CR=1 FL=1